MHFCDEKNQNQLWDRVRPPRNPNSTLGGYFLKNRGTKLCLDVSTIKETGIKVQIHDSKIKSVFFSSKNYKL